MRLADNLNTGLLVHFSDRILIRAKVNQSMDIKSHIFRSFSKTKLQLKILQIWYLLSFLDTLSPLWSH